MQRLVDCHRRAAQRRGEIVDPHTRCVGLFNELPLRFRQLQETGFQREPLLVDRFGILDRRCGEQLIDPVAE